MVLSEITDRYSVRTFSDKKVPKDIIKNILEAGRLAPSWLNAQPWQFIVVQDKQNKALLSHLAHGQPHVEQASAVIVCCGDKSAWEEESFRKTVSAKKGITPEGIERFMQSQALNPKLRGEDAVIYRTLEGITYAIAYMTLEAQKNGIGACVIGAVGNELTGSVPEVYELVKSTLRIPEHLIVTALLILGYNNEIQTNPVKSRKKFNEIVSWEIFENKK